MNSKKGSWQQDNGGFSIMFKNGETLRFSRQEMVGPGDLMRPTCIWTPNEALGQSDVGN